MTSVLSTSLFLVACGGGSSDDGPATTNPSGTPTNNIQNLSGFSRFDST
ncbi:hypothetical protein [Acinetobacter baumannii]|nr:hypothetical protein [Acinetobacter baumannii]MCL6694980.1 hypothetical protein [Acinetobacter baumannii]